MKTVETLAQAITRSAQALNRAADGGYATERLTNLMVERVYAAADKAGIARDVAYLDLLEEVVATQN